MITFDAQFIQKITKKIKLFDAILFGGLLVVAVSFFFFFYRKAEYIQIRMKVTDKDVLYSNTIPQSWYARRFEVGDVELDALGRPITEITNIERFKVSSTNEVIYLDLKVRSTYDSRTKSYSSRGQKIMFGAPLRVNLGKVTFDGIVTEFPGSEQSQIVGKTIVKTIGRSVEPYLVSSVKKGDKIFDSNGVVLAEILDMVVKPAEQVTQTDSGDLLLRTNPLYKDIIVTVAVRTKAIDGGTWMFDNLPVKIDQQLPLNLEKVSIFPSIMEIISQN